MKLEEFVSYFDEVTDPRVERCKKHNLISIISLTVLACLCGAQCWEEISDYAESNYNYLIEFLDLSNGIPCKDTFARVIMRLNPKEFQQAILSLLQLVKPNIPHHFIPIDGKTIRRSHDWKKHQHPLHMVSAWSTTAGITLGQVKTEGKGNELKGIEQTLDLIDIKGSTVTIDALGCQKKIAEKIIEKEANYILAVKANQGSLHTKLINLFKRSKELNYDSMVVQNNKSVSSDHGRIETREYTILPIIYAHEFKKHWSNINALIKVESKREIKDRIQVATRYYITSLPYYDTTKISEGIRRHWSIENSLHWCLDVALNEDQCRIRKGNGPENMAIIRRFILSILKSEITFRGGIRRKQRKALMQNDYLNLLLSKI
jgi:predicted transposase YbfD/YdcC